MEPDFVWQFLSSVLRGLWEVKWPLAAFVFLLAIASALRMLPRRYRKPKGPGANVIAQADWREFERLTAIALRQAGYAVRENPADQAQPDGGVDLEARRHGKRYLVQCKHLRSSVSVKVVRELYGEMAARGADGCIVACSSTFSKPAREWAVGRQVQLLDGNRLARILDSADLDEEVRSPAPEPEVDKAQFVSCPKCGSKMVLRTAKRGARSGQRFWGCSRFPTCRGLRKA
ncbi:MAG: restriction endonuclease [Candidatus Tectomicrobia bacterium]|nr:restriction endonuclease [Candidatus Tectomicrobia bacterium]